MKGRIDMKYDRTKIMKKAWGFYENNKGMSCAKPFAEYLKSEWEREKARVKIAEDHATEEAARQRALADPSTYKTYTVIRIYDRHDETTYKYGRQYFLVLPYGTNFDDFKDTWDYEAFRHAVCNMGRMEYNTIAVGTASISDVELYGCELMRCDYDEAHIDVARVAPQKVYEYEFI